MKKLSLALLSTTLVALSFAPIAEAKFRGFGGGGFRSKTSFSRTSTAPKPTYRPAPSRPTTVYNRTTVVQQSSGGGMFSGIVGTVVGVSVYNWLFGEDEQQEGEK
ncbi:hypothetical protein U8C32_08470 [Sinorhizobium medicae]|uniref:hypothetical protein n=1 Tax=Sinorhizobium medicae TaxID=110321 RepID=UPI002AF6BE78|nr:hypothetical protein [Sinorhizobium medicae]WQO46958.1 hypothetical protein U8C42_08515 [Sinorhizobium medicae]WQO63910.1 hypothetical protein U8C40_11975 [Sinorhizobium medicae]WQO74320.1 hypothetical protein U8C31_08675 [Sinorhizobium medicae]WQO93587.1 hypothetical protein U8C32_08470 [Sinorhizobium medicae]